MRYSGNFSASDHYHNGRREFRKKQISPDKIKKRWFRNFYVLEQTKGYFVCNTFILEFGKFDPAKYDGTYYGPFYKEEDATSFGDEILRLHNWFMLS